VSFSGTIEVVRHIRGFCLSAGIEAVAQQVNDAGLHDCPRKDGGDRLREAFEAVDNGDQDVFDAAVTSRCTSIP
jgi:hypothetical protein